MPAHRFALVVDTSPGGGLDLHLMMALKANGVPAPARANLSHPTICFFEITKAHPTSGPDNHSRLSLMEQPARLSCSICQHLCRAVRRFLCESKAVRCVAAICTAMRDVERFLFRQFSAMKLWDASKRLARLLFARTLQAVLWKSAAELSGDSLRPAGNVSTASVI